LRAIKAENAAKPLRLQNCGWDLHCIAVIERRIRKWETESEQKETPMRSAVVENAAPAISNEWPWRVWSSSLRFGDVTYARGTIVPDDVLKACANADHLIRNGYIRRMAALPGKQRKTPAPAAPAVAMPVMPTDYIKTLFDAMADIAAKRKRPIQDVEDIVDRTIWDRATKQFIEERKRLYGYAQQQMEKSV
jgi:hypothetical protein